MRFFHSFGFRFPAAVALLLCSAASLRADVTMRLQATQKFTVPPLPPGMEAPRLPKELPDLSSTLYLKGDKIATVEARAVSILDIGKKQVTFIDNRHKRIARVSLDEWRASLAAAFSAPPELQANEAAKKLLSSIHPTSDARRTDRTAVIQGVSAVEDLVTIALTMDLPPLGDKKIGGPLMQIEIELWTARPEETARHPAMLELSGYSTWMNLAMNPAGFLKNAAGMIPGGEAAISPALERLLSAPSVMLRQRTRITSPLLESLGALHAAASDKPATAAPAPAPPFYECNYDVVELSTAAVDAAVFRIPEDYMQVTFKEYIEALAAEQLELLKPAPKETLAAPVKAPEQP